METAVQMLLNQLRRMLMAEGWATTASEGLYDGGVSERGERDGGDGVRCSHQWPHS